MIEHFEPFWQNSTNAAYGPVLFILRLNSLCENNPAAVSPSPVSPSPVCELRTSVKYFTSQ